MAGRHRIITLLLLLCGLCTAPLGSLEQAPADGPASVSVPHASAVHGLGLSAVRIRGHGGSGKMHGGTSAALPGHHERVLGALTPRSTPDSSARAAEWSPLLTYHANAPPRGA